MTKPVVWIQFLAHLLFVLAAWTVFIKYLFPLVFSVAYGEHWAAHIYWDLWPLAHVWLGWALLARVAYVRQLAIVMAVIEILIIVTKFVGFLADPQWSIWQVNWFVNKVFILGGFLLILATAMCCPDFFCRSSSSGRSKD